MEAQEQKVQSQHKGEENVLDFNLEDISLEDIDQEASAAEEDVIELTDLVERGTPPEKKAEQEVVDLLTSDEPAAKEGEFELSAEDLAGMDEALEGIEEKNAPAEPDVGDFALEVDLTAEEKQALPSEAKEPEEVISDVDLDQILKAEESADALSEEKPPAEEKQLEEVVSAMDLDAVAEKPVQEPLNIISEEIAKAEAPLAAPPQESAPAAPEPMPQVEPLAPVPAAEAVPQAGDGRESADDAPRPEPASMSISEEKLEAMVTKVVQDVLERVARETMASVAERVIGEAIESLKKSLAETP